MECKKGEPMKVATLERREDLCNNLQSYKNVVDFFISLNLFSGFSFVSLIVFLLRLSRCGSLWYVSFLLRSMFHAVSTCTGGSSCLPSRAVWTNHSTNLTHCAKTFRNRFV